MARIVNFGDACHIICCSEVHLSTEAYCIDHMFFLLDTLSRNIEKRSRNIKKRSRNYEINAFSQQQKTALLCEATEPWPID